MTDLPEPPAGSRRDDPREMARRLGEAARDARHCLDDLDNTPWPEMDARFYMQATWTLDVALRELLEAIEAVTADNQVAVPRPTSRESCESPADAGACLSGESTRSRIEDWLIWSAINAEKERSRADDLAKLTALDLIPGLRAVVNAFPPDLTDVGKLAVLRSPLRELGDVTATQWLLLGGDANTVVASIQRLLHKPPPAPE